jgi:transposase-like protein
MLAWGRTVVRARWLALAGTAALILVGGAWGTGVFGALSGGGFDDPASPSSRAHSRIFAEFGPQGQDVIALYTSSSSTVDEAGLRGPIEGVLERLDSRTEVDSVLSYYTTAGPLGLPRRFRTGTSNKISVQNEGAQCQSNARNSLQNSVKKPSRWSPQSSRPIVKVARELNIKTGTLGNWVNTYRLEHAGEEPPLTISERARLRELEKEVRELRMKAEFLGKAAAFFAQEYR